MSQTGHKILMIHIKAIAYYIPIVKGISVFFRRDFTYYIQAGGKMGVLPTDES